MKQSRFLHDGMMLTFAVSVLSVVLVCGCGKSDYRLMFKVENGAFEKGAEVRVDGKPAGTITDVRRQGATSVATVSLDRSLLPDGTLRAGTDARLATGGGIEIDTSEATANAPAVKNGTTVLVDTDHSGRSVVPLLAQYSVPLTMVAIAGVVIILYLLYRLFKAFFHLIAIIICLALAGVLSLLVQPWTVPIAKGMYEDLDAYQEETYAGESSSEESGSDTLTVLAENLPDPRYVAVGVSWIVLFAVMQTLVGTAMRRSKAPAKKE